MIEFTERSFAIWYVQANGMDWLAHIESTEVPDEFLLTYRFRYYVEKSEWDDDEWDKSKDRKNWYTCKAKGMAKGIEAARTIATLTKLRAQASSGRGELWEMLRGTGTLRDFMEQCKALPFMHWKQLSKEEFEKETGKKSVLEK